MKPSLVCRPLRYIGRHIWISLRPGIQQFPGFTCRNSSALRAISLPDWLSRSPSTWKVTSTLSLSSSEIGGKSDEARAGISYVIVARTRVDMLIQDQRVGPKRATWIYDGLGANRLASRHVYVPSGRCCGQFVEETIETWRGL